MVMMETQRSAIEGDSNSAPAGGPSSPSVGWLLAALVIVPATLIIGKQPWSPLAPWLQRNITFVDIPGDARSELRNIVFVPLAALLVVFTRITLGIRVLGPFRSILLATAFKVTGAVQGVGYLTVAMALFLGLRPLIKSLRLPYFGRATMMLCCVTALMAIGALSAKWFQIDALGMIIYFPIVVLSLVADAFAKVAAKEGMRSAIWRCAMTASLAIAIAWLMNNGTLRRGLLAYPELIFMEMAGIIVVCRWLPWRLFDRGEISSGVRGSSQDGDDEDDEEVGAKGAKRVNQVPLQGAREVASMA